MKFFKRLSYSFGNEDWDTERQALKINSGDTVFCISASGDRSLHPLMDGCDEVYSIDANPVQNDLLKLKMAAMDQLNFTEYLSFLGAIPSKNRSTHLKRISHAMDSEAAKYWIDKEKSIESGILFQGALERFGKITAFLLHTLRPQKTKQLFTYNDAEQQHHFVTKEWDNYYWKSILKIFLGNPFFTKVSLNDPTLYVDSKKSVASWFQQRLNNCLKRHPAKECSLLSLIFNGKITKEAFPPYLTEDGFNKIKPRLGRIKPHTEDAVTFLEKAPSHKFDAYSLSDISSFLNESEFQRMIEGMYRTAKPGARFSIRQVLTNHQIPNHLENTFKRDFALEKKLEEEDRCFVYRYMVGHIQK